MPGTASPSHPCNRTCHASGCVACVPLLGSDFRQWCGPDRAGIVDNDIERAEMRGDPVGNAANIVIVADVEQARLNVGPCFTREARGILKRVLINMPNQKQPRTLSRKG